MRSRSLPNRSVLKTIKTALCAAPLMLGAATALATTTVTFTKSPDGQVINIGDTATFTYMLTNTGLEATGFLELTDLLPAGGNILWSTASDGCLVSPPFTPGNQTFACDLNALQPRDSISVSVSGVPTACGVLSSVAEVDIDNNNPPTIDNAGTITIPCGRPLFVIGDIENHATGSIVNFWGAQWWKNNIMSHGASNGVAGFKGFASDSDVTCGGTWQSRPGNSSNPPDTIPADVMVIVTDAVQKNGSNIGGTITQILTVHSDGNYGPNPGHAGSGTVSSVFCGQPQ